MPKDKIEVRRVGGFMVDGFELVSPKEANGNYVLKLSDVGCEGDVIATGNAEAIRAAVARINALVKEGLPKVKRTIVRKRKAANGAADTATATAAL